MAHRLLDAEKVNSYVEGLLAAELIQQKFNEDVSLWAASEASDLEQALRLLQQDCELCTETYPLNKMVSMLKCTHSCCQECAKNYFTIQVKRSNFGKNCMLLWVDIDADWIFFGLILDYRSKYY